MLKIWSNLRHYSVWGSVSAIALGVSLPAIAIPKELIISSKQNQTFPSLVQEAESTASNFLQQNFQSSTSELNVYILGERNGQQVPLIWVTVSPAAWQRDPQIKSWAKYFGNADYLLGFAQRKTIVTTPSVVTKVPSTPTSTSATSISPKPPVPATLTNKSIYPNESEPNFYK
jgi:hypothetical protein